MMTGANSPSSWLQHLKQIWRTTLETLTVKELLALPQAVHIKGRHKMKKADLIAALQSLGTPAEEKPVVVVVEPKPTPPSLPLALAAMSAMGSMPVDRSFGGIQMSRDERDRLKKVRMQRKKKAKLAKKSKRRNRKAA